MFAPEDSIVGRSCTTSSEANGRAVSALPLTSHSYSSSRGNLAWPMVIVMGRDRTARSRSLVKAKSATCARQVWRPGPLGCQC